MLSIPAFIDHAVNAGCALGDEAPTLMGPRGETVPAYLLGLSGAVVVLPDLAEGEVLHPITANSLCRQLGIDQLCAIPGMGPPVFLN